MALRRDEADLQRLGGMLQPTARPGVRALLLSGVPGAGTSMLLDELVDRLACGSPVLRASRAAAGGLTGTRRFALAGALVGIDPGFAATADTLKRVLEAAEKLCAEGPVLLVADDVHAAVPDSLALMPRLVDLAGDLPLTVLLAHRPFPAREQLVTLAARPDVYAADLLPLDDDGLTRVVEDRCGAPSSALLRAVLVTAGSNPLHVRVLLDGLRRRQLLRVVDGAVQFAGGELVVPRSVQLAARAEFAPLEPGTRDLLRALAVWSGPATLTQLAALAGHHPLDLVASVRAALDPGAARTGVGPDGEESLDVGHEVYRDVLTADLGPAPGRMLHAAPAAALEASVGPAAQVLHRQVHVQVHVDAVGVPARALQVATTDLGDASAQAADLLAAVAERVPPGRLADEIALAQALALSGAGQMREAARAAHGHLVLATDAAARGALARVLLHVLLDAADVSATITLLEQLEPLPLSAEQRVTLARVRHLTVVMGGREPVPAKPDTTRRPDRSVTATALELLLRARARDALAAAVADVEEPPAAASAPAWSDVRSAAIWPAYLALFAEGPSSARERSIAARRQAQHNELTWLTPGLLFVASGIDYLTGRWDDALAEADAGLEAARASGSGWISRTVAQNLTIRTARGELTGAATALVQWKLRGLPEQLGLPAVAAAEMLLLEASGRLDRAAEVGGQAWAAALDSGRLVWALIGGPDAARVALTAGDEVLLARVAADVAAVPTDQIPTWAPAADLVAAVAGRDPDRAAAAAAAFGLRGNVPGELAGWEEAAVAAAARGETARARGFAARCATLAATLQAGTI
jgi:hypothetical protein